MLIAINVQSQGLDEYGFRQGCASLMVPMGRIPDGNDGAHAPRLDGSV